MYNQGKHFGGGKPGTALGKLPPSEGGCGKTLPQTAGAGEEASINFTWTHGVCFGQMHMVNDAVIACWSTGLLLVLLLKSVILRPNGLLKWDMADVFELFYPSWWFSKYSPFLSSLSRKKWPMCRKLKKPHHRKWFTQLMWEMGIMAVGSKFKLGVKGSLLSVVSLPHGIGFIRLSKTQHI